MQESFVCHKTRWLPSASNISFTKMARFVPWEYLDFESHQFKLQLLTFSWISFLINFWRIGGRQRPVNQSWSMQVQIYTQPIYGSTVGFV